MPIFLLAQWFGPEWIIAIGTVAAALIYLLTFLKVNEQTKLSREQLEISKGERAELLKPQLVVEITNVVPADEKDGPTANVTFTIRNLGGSMFRVIRNQTTTGIVSPAFEGLIEVPPGASQDIVRRVFRRSTEAGSTYLYATFDVRAVDGRRFQQQNQWTLDLSGRNNHEPQVSKLVYVGPPEIETLREGG